MTYTIRLQGLIRLSTLLPAEHCNWQTCLRHDLETSGRIWWWKAADISEFAVVEKIPFLLVVVGNQFLNALHKLVSLA